MNKLVCLGNEAAIIGAFEIDVDVSCKRAVFVPNHGWAMREGDLRYLPQRNLCPGWSADQHATHLVDIAAEIPLVADVDGITFSALDVLSDILSADAG